MKKLNRDVERYDVFDLFSSMATKHGYKLNDSISQNDFIERIRKSFENSKNNDITVYGKRIEALFAYVVGALGKTALLKQEDSGSLYYSEGEIIPPDYRLVVECHDIVDGFSCQNIVDTHELNLAYN